MSLSNVRIHPDWADRERMRLADDQAVLRGALAVVVLSIVLMAAARLLRLPFGGHPELADAAIGVLFLAFTLLAAYRRRRRDRSEGWPRWPGWPTLATGVLSGLGVGIAIALLLLLSGALGGAHVALRWPPAPGALSRWVVAFSLRSSGEELLFRGALFGILYNRLGWSFWPAALATVPLELALYLVQIPSGGSPPLSALAMLGPCLTGLASTALYATEGSLIGPIVNNAVFQGLAIAVGLY